MKAKTDSRGNLVSIRIDIQKVPWDKTPKGSGLVGMSKDFWVFSSPEKPGSAIQKRFEVPR